MRKPYPTYVPRIVTAGDVATHDAHKAQGKEYSDNCRLCRAVMSVE